MTRFDVFNGDADGICSLVQMRRAEPVESQLVTGVKRRIDLLRDVPAEAGDQILVLDISHDVNREPCAALLERGAQIRYFDHHFAGELPTSPNFEGHIDTAPEVCTALLVDQYLDGRFGAWAVTAAFGDNLDVAARERARSTDLNDEDLLQLSQLGVCINYNGYGATIDDLHFAPADLYRLLSPYDHPLEFLRAEKEVFEQLHSGYQEDLANASKARVLTESDSALALALPNEPWSRRVSGVHANDLAQAHPDRAHAILTDCGAGLWLVSVRAPISNRTGADELVRQFPTGGGRAAAAGINELPEQELDRFLESFGQQWS